MSVSKTTKASKFSLIAGVLILANAVLLGVVTTWFPTFMPTIPGTNNADISFNTLVAIGLICGSVVLLSSFMSIISANKNAWGAVAIVFSIPTVIMGGGFIIGFIFGIIGGLKTIKYKPEMQAKENNR